MNTNGSAQARRVAETGRLKTIRRVWDVFSYPYIHTWYKLSEPMNRLDGQGMSVVNDDHTIERSS